MSRVSENKEVLELIPYEFKGEPEEVKAESLATLVYIFADISMSLAAISDAMRGIKHE